MTRRVVTGVLLVPGSLLLTGCGFFGQHEPDTTGTETPRADASTTQHAPSSSSTPPPARGEHGSGSAATGLPRGTVSQARAQALSFMKAFARPGKGQEARWLPELSKYMTPDAASEIQIPPQSSPFKTVHESVAPAVAPGGDGRLIVTVRTDQGDWDVTLQQKYGRLLVIKVPELNAEQPPPPAPKATPPKKAPSKPSTPSTSTGKAAKAATA